MLTFCTQWRFIPSKRRYQLYSTIKLVRCYPNICFDINRSSVRVGTGWYGLVRVRYGFGTGSVRVTSASTSLLSGASHVGIPILQKRGNSQ